jgi:hypothetical protein
MSLSMGAFKECYRNQSIFWDGAYNLDGSGSYRTIGEARAAVDRMHEQTSKREAQEKEAKIAGGAIVCERQGDTVFVNYPDGTREEMTIRQFRQRVFKIEDQYGLETVFA